MALPVLKENATLEELRQWAVEVSETYTTMETDLQAKTTREQELITYNNRLFAKVTTKKDEKEDTKEEDIPLCIDEKTFKLLSDKDIQTLNELLEEEDD